jgi:hypothetical protein
MGQQTADFLRAPMTASILAGQGGAQAQPSNTLTGHDTIKTGAAGIIPTLVCWRFLLS